MLAPIDGDVVQLPDGARGLAYDHDDVAYALEHVRAAYRSEPDPAGLTGDEFTLLELQTVHAAVQDEPLQKDTFRRRTAGRLVGTGAIREGTVGKPARLFPAAWNRMIRARRTRYPRR